MAKQAAKVALNQHKGSLSAADCTGYTGVGSGSGVARAVAATEVPKVEADAADGKELDGEVSDDSEDPKLEDVAPVQGALGKKPAEVKKDKAHLTEQEQITEVEDALHCFKHLKTENDDDVTEEVLSKLASDLKKAAASARKRSLIHYAKKMLDLMQLINGAKVMYSKAKAYRKKKTEASGKALLAAQEFASTKYELMDDMVPVWIHYDIFWLEADRMQKDRDIKHAIQTVTMLLLSQVLGDELAVEWQQIFIFKMLIKFVQVTEKTRPQALCTHLTDVADYIISEEHGNTSIVTALLQEHLRHALTLLKHKTSTSITASEVQVAYNLPKIK